MPVREAFQILAADGLIQARPNKGAVVLGINEQTIREHYEIRAVLERKPWRKLSSGPIFHASPSSLCRREGAGDNNSAEYSDLNQGFPYGDPGGGGQ